MSEVELDCAVYGEATVFPVKIALDAKVSALQEAIVNKKKPVNARFNVDPSTVALYLARKKQGGNDEWLKSDATIDDFLKRGRQQDGEYPYVKMIPNWRLKKNELLGPRFTPGDDEIHVLVELPPVASVTPTQETGGWLVRGSIANAFSTRGVRCKLYDRAGKCLGYYDPARRTDDKNLAFWYEGESLWIHVLFKTEESALQFENYLRKERLRIDSPLNARAVVTSVVHVPVLPNLERIFYDHYKPEETESPQGSMSSFSASTSTIDTMTDEFKYQRIEDEEWFGPVVKAQSCHLMSREHCKRYSSYNKYDRDKSNRLALSAEMHGWYDGQNCAVPVFNISVESCSEHPVIDNRHEVKLVVRPLNAGYGQLISMRLKKGSSISRDFEEMRTSVYVENPSVFSTCMAWKQKQIAKSWEDYFSMTAAVD